MYLEERNKAEEKKKTNELKDKEREEFIEKKRIEKIKENVKIKILHQERLEKETQKIEQRTKINTELMEQRLIKSEMKRQQLEELRTLVFKKKSEETVKKQEGIQEYFLKEKEKEEMRNSKLGKKLMEVEVQKKIVDKLKDEEIKQKINELKMRERKTFKAREIKEKIENFKRDNLVDKINGVDYKIQIQKETKERELMFINEKNSLKRSETFMNIQRIDNFKEYDTEKKREQIEYKYQRLYNIKQQKSIILSHKRYLSQDTSKKRLMILNQFEVSDKESILEVNSYINHFY